MSVIIVANNSTFKNKQTKHERFPYYTYIRKDCEKKVIIVFRLIVGWRESRESGES